jgi:hypothetical protein
MKVGDEPYNGQEEFYIHALKARKINLEIVELGYVPRGSEVLLGCGQPFEQRYRHLEAVTKFHNCLALRG